MVDFREIFFSSFLIFLSISSVHGDTVSIEYDSNKHTFTIIDGKVSEKYVAIGNFSDSTNSTGWANLSISTNASYSNDIQARAAGIAEGYLTRNMISLSWRNTVAGYCDPKNMSPYCLRLLGYVQKNFAWMADQIRKYPEDPIFHQASLYLYQLDGLMNGYTATSSFISRPATILPITADSAIFKFILFQIGGDLEDLEVALQKEDRKHVLGSGSCSALIKLLPKNKDIYFAHDTWNTYQSMLRILKKYDFPFSMGKGKIPGTTMSFSSSPGVLYSGDDFYVINSRLVTMETTNGNSNPDLNENIRPIGTLFEGIRTMIANRLATSGKSWSQIFSKYNSGTYNNQWMVLDYSKFTRGQPLPDTGLLYVLEQLPGYVEYDDVTHVLKNHTYWASYNVPFFPKIYKMSGLEPMVKKYGDWFTHDKTARANIFRRDHHNVKDVDSMTKLMRYNNFKDDPLSKCNCTPPYSAENAISARSDLNPAKGKYPFGALGHRDHGATDMKMTTSTLSMTLDFYAIAGPTHDPLPPFDWSKADFGATTPHFGQPTVFKFDRIVTSWTKQYFL
ncbi:unnamed protein product [Owenia fusiformis]|uniref:Phospholipase B-like n=1 Tax=Owenia fusiformis TaxID=6347 RepID=A0A8S4Q8Y9_OWEFU|nr:unnamed protein product [Owenia fusiformis]